MKHQRITTVIIGEGPTEFYYLNSLKDDYRIMQSIKPDTPKNTSLRELAQSIEDSIQMGYNRIYCLIDMDTKYKDAKSMSDYQSLKRKYHGTKIYKPKAGVDCIIKFFETDLVLPLLLQVHDTSVSDIRECRITAQQSLRL